MLQKIEIKNRTSKITGYSIRINPINMTISLSSDMAAKISGRGIDFYTGDYGEFGICGGSTRKISKENRTTVCKQFIDWASVDKSVRISMVWDDDHAMFRGTIPAAEVK